MEKYDPRKIEKKWSKKWIEDKTFVPNLEDAKNPYYSLFMFPYPSAEGLHIGNFFAFVSADVMAKYMKLKGFDVFEPIGWDAFGIHSENYALKIRETPNKMLERTIKNFRNQLEESGLSCDWTRVVNTTDPEYYKWTQWIFVKLFEKGLAYQKEALVNWCPQCKTVLADEQIEADGVCERCKTTVEKRKMKQWFFKITDYAERLLKGLDEMDWSEITKSAQINWIGKSEGAEIKFPVIPASEPESQEILKQVQDDKLCIKVFTTRADTLFGCTYLVLSPEHELVLKITTPDQKKAVEDYIKKAVSKSELKRKESKEKTGMFTGAYAVNPINGKKVPIWVADYVLASYSTGAIMAVPAHDERDWEFSRKYNLPIKEVIMPIFGEKHEDEEKRNTISAVVPSKDGNKFLMVHWKEFDWYAPSAGGVDEGETPEQAVVREVFEETGYKVKTVEKLGSEIEMHFYADNKKVWRDRFDQPVLCELIDEGQYEIDEEEKNRHEAVWLTLEEVFKKTSHPENLIGFERYGKNNYAFTESGVLVNSGRYNGLSSGQAREEITSWLEENKSGKKETTYKLRDWCISRQRYWGPPIPIIYCPKCGTVIVPEKDLPVKLPELKKGWEPAGDGKGPLQKVDNFTNTACPKCKGPAQREVDVMDNFLDSAWYFFRYISRNNEKEIFEKKLGEKWLPVDFYVGGNEHAVLHLMYTRFITMFFHDLGLVNFDNPFKKFRANGMILKEGKKMSKSKGNVVSPEEYGRKIGYDALKTYLLFLGPLSENRNFSDSGIVGARNWAQRVFNLKSRAEKEYLDGQKIILKLNQTLKAVEDDMSNQKYNTAIAKLMELTNSLYGSEKVSTETWKKFLIMTAVFLPSLSEELWEKMGHKKSIFLELWPKYDEKLIQEEEIELVVQINGKLRDRIKVPADVTENEAKKVAMESEKIKQNISGKEIKKVIFVKGKLINIVI